MSYQRPMTSTQETVNSIQLSTADYELIQEKHERKLIVLNDSLVRLDANTRYFHYKQ